MPALCSRFMSPCTTTALGCALPVVSPSWGGLAAPADPGSLAPRAGTTGGGATPPSTPPAPAGAAPGPRCSASSGSWPGKYQFVGGPSAGGPFGRGPSTPCVAATGPTAGVDVLRGAKLPRKGVRPSVERSGY